MKLSNGQVLEALECMAVLCGPTNRLPTLAALKADRALRALRTAQEPVEAVRVKLVEEHGTKGKDGYQVASEDLPAFGVAYNELMGEETEVDVTPIPLTDIEAGYARDPETGKKEGLDISPAQLGALVELGLIVETVDG